jgi:apolipoprotein N-acyltransferase
MPSHWQKMLNSQPFAYTSLLLAGALMPLSLAPFLLWPIAIVCMMVLFAGLQNQSPLQALLRAAVFGFGLFAAGVSWVYVSMYNFGGVSMLFAAGGTALFCLLLAILFALPFTFSALIPQRPLFWLLGWPALWVVSEWFRSWIFTGFPWLYAGYSHTDTWLNGWAPIGGVLLLSYFTALTAAVSMQVVQRRLCPATIFSSLLVITVFVSGLTLQKKNWTEPTSEQLSVALIQPNIEQQDKWSPANRSKILKKLLKLTEDHWGADIIIWPEGALPALYTQIEQYLGDVDGLAKSYKSALITGLPTNSNPLGPYYNSMLVLGDGQGKYDKTRLVPFGEYVPFESLIRGLNGFFDLPMSSFSLGSKNQPPLTAKGQNIATAICYEIAYPDLVVKNARNTSIILTTSNDAWFGASIAPHQHMQMARMRAIENGKPLMRGTNNGITALVDHRGAIFGKLEQFSDGVLTGRISLRTGETPFSRFASWPVVFFSLFIVAIFTFHGVRRRTLGAQ